LHNKLLWIDASIKEINEINNNFKNDFSDLMRTNELLIDLIRKNPNPDPSAQRISYANNLENFANGIEDYLTKHISDGIKIMTQIKIYNNNVRKRWGFYFVWKNEGRRFKFFKNKTEYKKFSRNLDSIDRIDRIIQKEVDEAIINAKERSAKLNIQHE
jgi:hypothetical protein